MYFVIFFYRLKIENEDYKTTFILTKAKRSDTGTYKVTAKNDSGTDSVDLEIQVLSMLFHFLGLNIYRNCFLNFVLDLDDLDLFNQFYNKLLLAHNIYCKSH